MLLNVGVQQLGKKHKEKTLCENPDILFTDYTQHKEGRKKNNLIFFPNYIYTWKDTLCNKYAYISSEGISSEGRLKICKDQHLDKDDPLLHTYYTKIMVQGNEANLEFFKEAISLLKAEMITKRINFPSHSEDGEESMALLELDYAEFKELT